MEEKRPLLAVTKEQQEFGATDNDNIYCGVPKSELFNTPPEGLSSEEAERRLKKFGKNELAEKEDNKWVKLALEFVQPMPLMIWAAIGLELTEALLEGPQYWIDVGVLVTLQLLNVLVGFYEELQAGNAIAQLKASLKPEATVKRDNMFQVINAGHIVPGDILLIGAGAAIPADCTLLEGKSIQVDQAALTGESLPVTMRAGDVAKMGSTCVRGEIEAIASATGSETFFGKTACLINNVDEMAHFEKVFQQINIVLTGMGSVIVILTFGMLSANGADILNNLSFCVVLLISSIPIAMRVVCTTTMALGCRILAGEKAIVARLSAVEELAGMDMLCSDKTGTLTMNKMELQEDMPLFAKGIERHDVLVAAALSAKWKEPPKDALDTLVLNALDLQPLDKYMQTDYMPFDPTVKRTEATIQRPDGTKFKVTKGAPHVLLELAHNKDEIRDLVEGKVMDLAKKGIRSLAVACTNTEDDGWVFMGIMTFLDPPRPDTKITIQKANMFGVGVKMITGDHKAIAVEMCRRLGMGETVLGPDTLPVKRPEELDSSPLGDEYGPLIEGSDGFAQVFPEHKYLIVEALRQRGYIVGMTGDGVNDSPALKRADVGIAVSGSTDAARASADIVLTEPGLTTIVTAIVTSRKIFTRMKNFVIYRVACTVQLLFFFFVSCLIFDPSKYDDRKLLDSDSEQWPQYFSIPVLALVTITILNDGTLIAVAYDNVSAGKLPEKWELTNLYIISSVIGGIAMVSSLVLLQLALDTNNEDGFLRQVGLPRMEYEEIMTLMYLKIALSDYFSLFNSRTKSFCWTSRPSNILMVAFFFATICSTILATHWPKTNKTPNEDLSPIPSSVVMFVWIYTILWSIVQDAGKVLAYNALETLGWIKTIDTIKQHDLDGLGTSFRVDLDG
mmetsp:Transcript_36304/g.43876  ORF Transcript_36304/g.43876 Transcript_36304/m.43876 type:complete len:903 (+) Transcript_36304:236-2944(+)|eukprot:CAMPEP_0197862480 /NCGR_PEP_ID=MMETSP1438-20131217/39279_1 /TAXON_ID=1461541 /ORGANISM="Pterosperma sp., Strain CCMP1384" /LENGTH=902 /DNA_ID=CAMNT_0043480057 /DNA_START=230 /DNA_END=2938 /DNA_ORIENTATION=+